MSAQTVDATQALNFTWGFECQSLTWPFVELTGQLIAHKKGRHDEVHSDSHRLICLNASLSGKC